MKRALIFLIAAAFVLTSSASFAATQNFKTLSVYVPDGWTAIEDSNDDGAYVWLLKNDYTAQILIQAIKESRDIQEVANENFTEIGTGELTLKDGLYSFETQDGMTAYFFDKQYNPYVPEGFVCVAMFQTLAALNFTMEALLLTVSVNIVIDTENFPDDAFRTYISQPSFDKDGNGTLTITEINGIYQIQVSGKNIKSLQGIEYFTSLLTLDCSNNALSTLDVSKNIALKTLWCDENQLTFLDVSKCTSMKTFMCFNTMITSLDLSGFTSLTALTCGFNQIVSLDVSGCTSLRELNCYHNNIRFLDINGCTNLKDLSCGNNSLSALNVTTNTALVSLDCWNNQITSLDVSKLTHLRKLDCRNNQIAELYLRNNLNLETLKSWNNSLAYLDLTANTKLNADTSLPANNESHDNEQAHNIDGLIISRSGDSSYPYQLDLRDYVPSELTGRINPVMGFDDDNVEIPSIFSGDIVLFKEYPGRVAYRFNTGFNNSMIYVNINGPDYGKLSLYNHVYQIFNRALTWRNAKEYCESLGGHLVTISNDKELELVNKLVGREDGGAFTYSHSYIWTGGHKNAAGTWEWTDGKAVIYPVSDDYEEWQDNIVGYERDCLALSFVKGSEGYIGRNNSYLLGFICEWEPSDSEFAPYTEEYTQYIADPEGFLEGKEFYGALPSALDLSHLENNPAVTDSEADFTASALESKYNPLENGVRFPIRDQGTYGTCWTFSSLGTLEASYINQKLGSTARIFQSFIWRGSSTRIQGIALWREQHTRLLTAAAQIRRLYLSFHVLEQL